ncbi:hypothetical protein JYT72_01400 [Crocinitomix catalasitica]|nr:hypothetical protein [Crocinitomix catalasitica]
MSMTQNRIRTLKFICVFAADFRVRKQIIFLDKIWNNEAGIGTDSLAGNISRHHRIFKNLYGRQIVWYHRGIRNDNDNGWFNTIKKGIRRKPFDAKEFNHKYNIVE